MSVLWRKRKMILGLVGGKCSKCGTPQFPKMDICVNPACGAMKSQDDYEFADVTAVIKTFTGDLLAVSVDPPAMYGMIQFEGGGRMMADFTDCGLDDLKVGLPVKMEFKRRVVDEERGNVNYFWKAVPDAWAEIPGKGVRFDDRVAIITGAGGGLGRVYALELAKRGAKIVINDFGGARDGTGDGSEDPADKVVKEIEELGGEAVVNYDTVTTVEGGENIVKTAIDTFGRVDILINNAGILRDKSIMKMEPENWHAVLDVHLNGAYNVTRPAFQAMREKGYGRIIMTTSAAGLYGNFGQTNYSSAKMGLVGFMNTLKIEGSKYDIKVNTVAPVAASRLTADILPPDLMEKMKPEYVAPIVLYLCSEECKDTGVIFNTAADVVSRAAILTGSGAILGDGGKVPSVEEIRENIEKINSMEGAKETGNATEAIMTLVAPPAGEKKEKKEGGGSLTVRGVFEKLPGAFRPDRSEGVDVIFQFTIAGPGGGDWFVEIKDGACKVEEGSADKPTTTIKMADDDFVQLILGKLDGMQAFSSGKLKVEGDMMKSQLIAKLFKFRV